MKCARPLLLAASTVALLISACSQPADIQAPDLAPQYGTAEDDIGVDVAVSSAGQVYTLTNQAVPSEYGENFQVLLRRYDGSGRLLSNRQVAAYECPDIPECDDFKGRVLQVDARGNTYTLVARTGISMDTWPYIDYYLYKHDAAGKLIRKVFVGTNFGDWADRGYRHENAIGMAVDGSGNVYLAHEVDKYEYNDGYDSYSTTNLVAKYSASGALLWQRATNVGVPYGVTVSSSGSVYVVGTTGLSRYTSSGGLTWSVKADNSKGTLEDAGDIVISGSGLYTRSGKDIRKYDGNGKQLWLRTQGGLNTLVLKDVAGDSSGNIYISGKYQASTGNTNAFVRKLNANGSTLWTETFGTSAYDEARAAATVSGSEIYVTGLTQGSLAHTNMGGRDGYLRKLSSSGNPIWTR